MYGYSYGIDPYYYLVIPAFLLSLIAQWLVKSTFNKYSRVGSMRGMTGADTARMILERNGIYDVRVEAVAGSLTDHYDPRTKVVRLSQPVYSSRSLAAVGVAAHETGHAIQHAKGYAPLVLRSTLYPLAGIGSSFGIPMAMLGFIFSLPFLIHIGIILFAMAVAFYVITLPVEINASTRAIACIRQEQILGPQEIGGAKKVLTAAAMTYVAAAAVAIAHLLRLILLSRSRSRD
ncbi:MAG: zinc metallopeptidase [Eubacteriales bacterium]|nr:zinc metallopeptidase [Eubacteriales bacterium]